MKNIFSSLWIKNLAKLYPNPRPASKATNPRSAFVRISLFLYAYKILP